MEIHNPATEDFKCPTCLQSFLTLQKHKEHYKSDFHRYNLKRKMVKLSPVGLQQFLAKKVELKKEEVIQFKCNQCGKKFNSAQTLNQHGDSKKHKIFQNSQDIQEEKPIKQQRIIKKYSPSPLICLFCLQSSKSLEENIEHMLKKHSFFIPQEQFCINKQGLLQYLQEKIEVGFMCICCDNKKAKDFNSGLAVRKHMSDKGHYFMKVQDGYQEYEKFYDFSKLFTQLVQEQKGRTVQGIQYTEVKVYADEKLPKANEQQEQQQWQDEEDDQPQKNVDDEWESASESEEQKIQEEKPRNKIKTYYLMKPTITNNQQLLLPNGKILGNRKYRHIYKQNYQEPVLAAKLKMLGLQSSGVNAVSSMNNIIANRQRLLKLVENDKIMNRYKQRAGKRHLGLGMQQNILIRKYFRCQNSL